MVKVLHLYYDLMNLYGEYGNIEVLNRHLLDQGLKVKIDRKTINNKIDFNSYDFIYCGSGLESNEMVALKDLLKRKTSLVKAIKANKLILLTGNAMELLGTSINDQKALGIVDVKTTITDKRASGDVVVDSKEFGEVVGFINKSSILSEKVDNPLFTYIFKDDGIKDPGSIEGYRVNNTFGTHIIGPILAKNPRLIRYVVETLGKNDKKTFKYKDIKYPYEEESYSVTLQALKERIK